MTNRNRYFLSAILALLACGALVGCLETDPEPRAPASEVKKATAATKANMGQNIWLEMGADGKRRVLVSAEVCLTRGSLEQLLTIKQKKEHEAIFAAQIDARSLRTALEVAGAKAGTPVRFEPVYRVPTGTVIKVSVQLNENGTTRTVPARSLIRNLKTQAELDVDWVFAGSLLVDDPFDNKAAKIFLANDGDVITVCNFESALLDLPVASSKGDEDRSYEVWTERIPKEGTKVVLVLEPQVPAKK